MGAANVKQTKEAESKLAELFALNEEKDVSLKLANLVESNAISEDLLRQLPLEQMGLGEIERRKTALLICCCAIRHIHTLATSEAPMAKNQGKQALIYLHILVRMVPRVMEFFSPEELRETFLKTSEIGKTVVFIMDAQGGGQALVEAKVDSGTPNGAPTKKEKTILLIQFVEALTGLFFKPGFAFPANQTSKQPNILPIWAGPRIKPPSSEHMVYRLSVLEGMLTVMYLAEYFGKELGLDYLGFYMSSRETAQPGFCQSFLLSLVQTGLKLRENGVFPYLSHLYTQETETRVSVLSLTLFAKFITREHHVDYIKGHIRTDPLLNLMRLSLSEGFATSQTGTTEQRFSVVAGAQLSDIQVESLTVDHLTKFIVSFDDMFIIKSWMVALMQNIRNPHDTANTLLPGSMKKTRLYEESLFVLLRLLRLSEKARTLAAAIPSYKSLIYIVVAQLVEQHYCGFSSNSTNPNGVNTWSRGLHQLMVVFLMEVSAHQSLCVEFNAVIPESVIIPQIPVFSGSSVDLLFVAISQLLIDDKPRGKARQMPEPQPSDPQDGNDDPSGQPRPEVAPIQTPPGNPFSPNYVAILRNISPFAKNLSTLASSGLCAAIQQHMSSERLLFSPDSMSILVGLMDVINRLLFHQFESNPDFLRELIRHTRMLLKIGKLNFSEGMLGRILYPDHYLPSAPVPQPSAEQQSEPKPPTTATETDLSKVPQPIRNTVRGLAVHYSNLKQQIDLLNIFRFQKYVEDHVLHEKANPKVEYSLKVRDILSKTSRVGIVTDNLQNLSVIISVSIRDFGFGLSLESILWETVSHKIVAHPSLNPIMMLPRETFWIAKPVETPEDTQDPQEQNAPESLDEKTPAEEVAEPAS